MFRAPLVFSLLLVVTPGARAELPVDDARVSGPLVEGLWLGASLEGAYLERDLWAGGSLGLGVEHARFALHLRAPLYLSVWDLEPAREEAVPACAVVRCAEWLDERGELRLESLSRIVDHVRLGRPGDLLYARAGPVFATLGTGRVTDRYLNSPAFDQRQSGVYARATLPFAGLSADAVVGNLFAPQRFLGARAELRPLSPFVSPGAFLGGFLSRLTVAADAAGDLTAPSPYVTTATGTTPLGSAALEVLWPLLEEGGLFSLTPFGSLGTAYGLSPTGTAPAEGALGFGASLGARTELRVPFVGVRFQGTAFTDGPGHRTSLFGTLYEIERRRAFAGATTTDGGIATVPAPGGLGWSARGELVFLDAMKAGLRYVEDTAPGGDTLEAYSEVGFWGFLAGARVIRRGVSGFDDVMMLDERTLVVAESSLRVFGPVSVFARWFRTPRFERTGSVRVDDDVLVGIAGDLVLGWGMDDGE